MGTGGAARAEEKQENFSAECVLCENEVKLSSQ